MLPRVLLFRLIHRSTLGLGAQQVHGILLVSSAQPLDTANGQSVIEIYNHRGRGRAYIQSPSRGRTHLASASCKDTSQVFFERLKLWVSKGLRDRAI